MIFRPQPGKQERFHATSADIALYGGAAGGGKSWSLLFEPLRHVQVPGFGAVIFRRTTPQIMNEGGLWDESEKMYGLMGARPTKTRRVWEWPNGQHFRFSHLEHEKNKLDYQGAQIPYIGFDELTHFSRTQFFYMLGRNRSTCGVKPYVRATCNPDALSWVADFIAWWIGPDGFPIEERCGVVRWFVTVSNAPVWGGSEAELKKQYPDLDAKSFTFINAKLTDNQILMTADPGYRANLQALPLHERMALEQGNWKAFKQGKLFRYEWFDWCEEKDVPSITQLFVGVDPSGGHTLGHDEQGIVAAGKGIDGKIYVFGDYSTRDTPAGWGRRTCDAYDETDADGVLAEANYGGEMVKSTIQTVDANVPVRMVTATRGKAVRAQPLASLYEKKRVVHVGHFPQLEAELVGFDPDETKASPNRMDALVWATYPFIKPTGWAAQEVAEAKEKEKK